MSDDFYPIVDSGDPAPDNAHLTGVKDADGSPMTSQDKGAEAPQTAYAARIAVYDDMLSTPRVIVIEPQSVRTYLEETTNTVYQCMKEQGGRMALMVIREIVENFIHAGFAEPIISILDGGNTIRFADQGPGIEDKERAFDFGVTSANSNMKRYIRGTGAGFPMVQEYMENAGGAVSIEDNMGCGTVVTVSLDPKRVREIERSGGRGAAVRPEHEETDVTAGFQQNTLGQAPWGQQAYMPMSQPMAAESTGMQQASQTPVPSNQQMPAMPQVTEQQPLAQDTVPANPYAVQQNTMPPQMWAGWPQQAQPTYQQPYANPYGNTQGYQQAPVGYQQWAPGFQQPGAQMYPSYQQPAAQMMYPNAAQQPTQQPTNNLFVSERGERALAYLAQQGQCGPTDLMRAFGSSAPTWSRELDQLAGMGLVIKRGQKYHLTELGQAREQQR